jgi:hypothetical protein
MPDTPKAVNRDEHAHARTPKTLVALPRPPLPQETTALAIAGPEGGQQQPVPAHLQTASDKRRAVERELSVFTPAQQRAIAIICGQWWESRLEAINVGEVEELRDKLDFLLEALGEKMPTQAQIATWKAKRNRQLQGPRG